jgi:two-component system, NtrC family, response regulator AtoC
MPRRRVPRPDPAGDERRLFTGALADLGGSLLVLDDRLRIRAATPAAEAALGGRIPIGASAATLLCGDRPKRPFAEALADGVAFQAVIPRPGQDDPGDRLQVRSVPLGSPAAGWLVYLTRLGAADAEPVSFHGMWTRDPRMKQLFRIIEKVAAEDATVLVRGETGSGKELVARAIHDLSPRRDGPLRAINCAALPSNLLESELFGHARGAFTGAIRDVPGHIELAAHGTLFLDEVADLSLELQAKLLRVLETRTVIPVGAREPVPVDVRIVSATHRSLRGEVEAGRFRADLMFRLRVIPIRLPPLRDRPRDVTLIAEKLIDELNARGRRRIERIAVPAQQALERYAWPGNVRELRNVLAYAFVIGEGPVLELADLPAEVGTPLAAAEPIEVRDAGRPPDEPGGDEARRIRDALARTGGNRERAALLIGVSRATLWRRMRVLGLAR